MNLEDQTNIKRGNPRAIPFVKIGETDKEITPEEIFNKSNNDEYNKLIEDLRCPVCGLSITYSHRYFPKDELEGVFSHKNKVMDELKEKGEICPLYSGYYFAATEVDSERIKLRKHGVEVEFQTKKKNIKVISDISLDILNKSKKQIILVRDRDWDHGAMLKHLQRLDKKLIMSFTFTPGLYEYVPLEDTKITSRFNKHKLTDDEITEIINNNKPNKMFGLVWHKFINNKWRPIK